MTVIKYGIDGKPIEGKQEKEKEEEEEIEFSKETLYRNFYMMSIAFSVNHGCAVTCLAFASTELGNSLGMWSQQNDIEFFLIFLRMFM